MKKIIPINNLNCFQDIDLKNTQFIPPKLGDNNLGYIQKEISLMDYTKEVFKHVLKR